MHYKQALKIWIITIQPNQASLGDQVFKPVWRARLCGGKMERPLKVAKITGWKISSKIILLFHFMLMFNSGVLDNKCLFFQSHLKINGVSQGGLLFIMLGGSFSNTYFCPSLPLPCLWLIERCTSEQTMELGIGE